MSATGPKYVTLREEKTASIVLVSRGAECTLPVQTYTQIDPRTLEPVTDEGILCVCDVRVLRELAEKVIEQETLVDELRTQLATRQPTPAQAPQ